MVGLFQSIRKGSRYHRAKRCYSWRSKSHSQRAGVWVKGTKLKSQPMGDWLEIEELESERFILLPGWWTRIKKIKKQRNRDSRKRRNWSRKTDWQTVGEPLVYPHAARLTGERKGCSWGGFSHWKLITWPCGRPHTPGAAGASVHTQFPLFFCLGLAGPPLVFHSPRLSWVINSLTSAWAHC